jgi:hypothetical protein
VRRGQLSVLVERAEQVRGYAHFAAGDTTERALFDRKRTQNHIDTGRDLIG